MKPKVKIGRDAFEGYKKECILERKSFTLEKSGSMHKIYVDSTVQSFLISDKTKGNVHLLQACKTVKSDAREFFINNEHALPPSDLFIPTEYTNFNALKEGQVVVSIDVEACYWRTAYLLNVISFKTYLKFLPHKYERNVAIGCLRRKTEQVEFQNGKETKRQKVENELNVVNVFIKKYIYDIFLEAQGLFDIIFYHTDEFWVSMPDAAGLKKFLKEKGFRTTSDVVKIDKITDKGIECFFTKAKKSKFVRKKKK